MKNWIGGGWLGSGQSESFSDFWIFLTWEDPYGHNVLFLCFRWAKMQNLMSEGEKKTFQKKPIELETLMRATRTNIWQITGKNNEGDKINKLLTYFFTYLLRALKKTSKNKTYLDKCFFISCNELIFVCVFLSPGTKCNRQQSNAHAGQKKCR